MFADWSNAGTASAQMPETAAGGRKQKDEAAPGEAHHPLIAKPTVG
jgi:hypothetical protein